MVKHILLTFSMFCILLLGSCKKLIEDKKKDALLGIITDGLWHVEEYNEATVIITDQFADYNFQFNSDGSVSGNNGISNTVGTWTGDVKNYTITSDFPGAEDPLKKLNGLWKVKDSGND